MFRPPLDATSDIPLYRQLFEHIRDQIDSGQLARGERLPATRELAGSLSLNRATVTAAYELLESEGLISGQVGRGSFVLGMRRGPGVAWDTLLENAPASIPTQFAAAISFATSRPPEELFPREEFRAACEEVMARPGFERILQLGAPAGYEPLRDYLLAEARRNGAARTGDDLLITNGCQQALDLLCRAIVGPGDRVAIEDPVYPGLKNLFSRAGARLAPLDVGAGGIDPSDLREAKVAVVTPNFQNPAGVSLPLDRRIDLVRRARAMGAVLVENDIYGPLRYAGEPLPSLKQLDEAGDVVLLGSFSKIAFPGLRVGWILGPKPLIAALTHLKHLSDLHTDQLSQAVLLRFAESGRLERHRARMLESGAARLAAVMECCAEFLPEGSRFTRPQGGMNLWVRLPQTLDARELLPRAQAEGVSYLPGSYFGVARTETNALRLSFASLPPEKIREGLAKLGDLFNAALAPDTGPAMAVV
jgi:2-aminoadipate transaminase